MGEGGGGTWTKVLPYGAAVPPLAAAWAILVEVAADGGGPCRCGGGFGSAVSGAAISLHHPSVHIEKERGTNLVLRVVAGGGGA
jgi:hypothetical protein